MNDYSTLASADFCKRIREKCPFDAFSEWIFYIDAEVDHHEYGRGWLGLISLDGDKETLNYSVTYESTETYKSWEFTKLFSLVHISPVSYPHVISDSLPSKKEFDFERASYRNRKEQEERRRKQIAIIREEIEPIIAGNDWTKIEYVLAKFKDIPIDIFDEVKSTFVQEYIGNRFGKQFLSDREKAAALASNFDHFLLKARAGSGKTTVIGMRTVLLVEKYNTHQDNVMLLAFNRGAAKEIESRIQSAYKMPTFSNARTFHSLAMRIVQPEEGLLFDEGPHVASQKLSNFVQSIVRDIWNPEFQTNMGIFFRSELKEIEEHGGTLSPGDYLTYRRNLNHITLRGETVKSKGEKYIADFLCEHNIPYRYEDLIFLKPSQQPSIGRSYRPDFTIYYENKTFRLEHWGIDETDNRRTLPIEWSGTWEEYHNQMIWKRSFWKEREEYLFETSVADLRSGREEFEKILKRRLSREGIPCNRLTDSEIFQKVIDFHRTRITQLFVQFIQKAKKQFLSPEDIAEKIQNIRSEDTRTGVFLDLASKVYENYQLKLAEDRLIDFDDLISRAVETIEKTSGECEIRIGRGGDPRTLSLNNIQHLMIDEYQDFSELFYRVVHSMKKFNPEMSIYAVGDDWQSINAFAGSDLEYFELFSRFFPQAETGSLLTNYRSSNAIVVNGNRIMRGKGEPGSSHVDNSGGIVNIEYIEDCWLSLPKKDEKNSDDLKFFFRNEKNELQYRKFETSRYLKRCFEIVGNNVSRTYMILNRTNRFPDGTTLEQFSDKLKACFSGPDRKAIEKQISVLTVHRSKGREADCVILLNAVKGYFPLIHPNSALFEIFGDSVAKTIDEERRLFYVACTRAKNALHVITEEKNESDFL